VLQLGNALYGLKQIGACFWEVMLQHLVSKGFTSMLGDPCFFRKILPDGKVIIAYTYVNDINYGVSDQATADCFLSLLRSRFVIDEGEIAPIDFFLGMAVHQDNDKGAIRMDIKMAITKLYMRLLTYSYASYSTYEANFSHGTQGLVRLLIGCRFPDAHRKLRPL